jgi:hypothetical protein
MIEPSDFGIALYVILIFVAFISGMFLGASLSPHRWYYGRKARETRHARLAAAEGGLGRNGKVRSANLLAFVISFVIGMVVLDHFTGPLFPDVFYTAHRNLIAKGP